MCEQMKTVKKSDVYEKIHTHRAFYEISVLYMIKASRQQGFPIS